MDEPDAAEVARFARILAPHVERPLTPHETVVLYARIVDLQTPAEIAARLRWGLWLVRRHLFKARAKLGQTGLHAWEPLIAGYWYAAGCDAAGVTSPSSSQ